MLTEQGVLAEAIRIVNNNFLGLLTTVDAAGVPHSRWMGSAAYDGIRRIYALSGKPARKLEHIRHSPHVCWVFSTPHLADVVTLLGRARVLDSPIVAQAAWDRLAECTRNYAMSALSDDDNIEFITIETEVEKVEFISPRLKVFHPQIIELG